MFNPMGCSVPFTLHVKVLFQFLCRRTCSRTGSNGSDNAVSLIRVSRARKGGGLKCTRSATHQTVHLRVETREFGHSQDFCRSLSFFRRRSLPSLWTRAYGSAGCRGTGTFRAEHIEAIGSLPHVLEWQRDRWKPFIRNQIEKIQQLVEPALWTYCPERTDGDFRPCSSSDQHHRGKCVAHHRITGSFCEQLSIILRGERQVKLFPVEELQVAEECLQKL
ncbi:hypothetical protein T4B_381 [Trichinella pseudospiralis]|uniref:Uncharacterized protein n=1 Tax=Trichinella pseudospiralis TaxID=6337 RepID=A0A0V1JMP6_TRIPS|nr:hypothetical protein T4B_381 [Trichinella pseudospiralis]KRZ36238.1 hypothetical protein T4C_5367 [Trichinella pseudospiralis]